MQRRSEQRIDKLIVRNLIPNSPMCELCLEFDDN